MTLSPAREHVIVLHGALRTHRHMAKLARALEAEGYRVHNIDYPSRRMGIAQLADTVHHQLAPALEGAAAVHGVGYSLGGLVLRAYLARYRPQALGNVVLLAVPNHGSQVADRLKHTGAFRWLYGVAGQELGTDQTQIAPLFAPVDYPLGVLAGTVSLDPLCNLWLPRPHDGKVSVASTRLDGMKEHKLIAATHTFFPTHPGVIDHTVHFIRHGRFAS